MPRGRVRSGLPISTIPLSRVQVPGFEGAADEVAWLWKAVLVSNPMRVIPAPLKLACDSELLVC